MIQSEVGLCCACLTVIRNVRWLNGLGIEPIQRRGLGDSIGRRGGKINSSLVRDFAAYISVIHRKCISHSRLIIKEVRDYDLSLHYPSIWTCLSLSYQSMPSLRVSFSAYASSSRLSLPPSTSHHSPFFFNLPILSETSLFLYLLFYICLHGHCSSDQSSLPYPLPPQDSFTPRTLRGFPLCLTELRAIIVLWINYCK